LAPDHSFVFVRNEVPFPVELLNQTDQSGEY